MPNGARQDLSEGRRVPLALTDRAEPRDGTSRRMYPDLARIEHAEAEDIAILDRAGADDLGEEADADAHQFAGLAAGEGFAIAPLLVRASRALRLAPAGGAPRASAGRLALLLATGNYADLRDPL